MADRSQEAKSSASKRSSFPGQQVPSTFGTICVISENMSEPRFIFEAGVIRVQSIQPASPLSPSRRSYNRESILPVGAAHPVPFAVRWAAWIWRILPRIRRIRRIRRWPARQLISERELGKPVPFDKIHPLNRRWPKLPNENYRTDLKLLEPQTDQMAISILISKIVLPYCPLP